MQHTKEKSRGHLTEPKPFMHMQKNEARRLAQKEQTAMIRARA